MALLYSSTSLPETTDNIESNYHCSDGHSDALKLQALESEAATKSTQFTLFTRRPKMCLIYVAVRYELKQIG